MEVGLDLVLDEVFGQVKVRGGDQLVAHLLGEVVLGGLLFLLFEHLGGVFAEFFHVVVVKFLGPFVVEFGQAFFFDVFDLDFEGCFFAAVFFLAEFVGQGDLGFDFVVGLLAAEEFGEFADFEAEEGLAGDDELGVFGLAQQVALAFEREIHRHEVVGLDAALDGRVRCGAFADKFEVLVDVLVGDLGRLAF